MTGRTGADLIDHIERLVVSEGQLALWALGQSGFVIKGGSTIAYIDPYLSNSITEGGGPQRRFPIPLDPATIIHAQIVFATHDHSDHVDAATLAPLLAASPKALLVTSPQGAKRMRDAGVSPERIVTPKLGEQNEIMGLAYRSIPAAHYDFTVDPEGRSTWQGFLITCNGVTLYHSGDTMIIPELLAALQGASIDLALLPYNGRDYFREEQAIVGNMWPREVVQLAQRIHARVLIGIHNDLFAGNRINPGLLFDALDHYAPWQRCHILQPGELYLYAG